MTLAGRFRTFARLEARPTSPLYAALAEAVADDPDLLALAERSRAGQPVPNLLFAAVHALLLSGQGPDLAPFYASLAERPAPPEGAVAPFRAFCLEHREGIAALLAARSVGTNEVARCAVIRAGLAHVMAQIPGPLHVVEIGASAGLLLLWDRVRVDYGASLVAGPADAPLVFACESRGAPPPVAVDPARVGRMAGIDLDPMDLENEADRRWLDALIWPEHRERRTRLRIALDAARAAGIRVRRGDGVADLPSLLASLPPGEAVCVIHAFTFNQIPADVAARFSAMLKGEGRKRPLFRLAYEWGSDDAPALALARLEDGIAAPPQLLAIAEAHGRWIEWRGSAVSCPPTAASTGAR
jgi:hypothetical protein